MEFHCRRQLFQHAEKQCRSQKPLKQARRRRCRPRRQAFPRGAEKHQRRHRSPQFALLVHPSSARAAALAALVAAIFAWKNSSKAVVRASGGPPSMMSRSGNP